MSDDRNKWIRMPPSTLEAGGPRGTLPQNSQSGHAWVIIEGRTLDAQTGVWDLEQWYPAPTLLFENLDEAQARSPFDWDWWVVRSELKEAQ